VGGVVAGLTEGRKPVERHRSAFGQRHQVVDGEPIGPAALDAAVAVAVEGLGAEVAPRSSASRLAEASW